MNNTQYLTREILIRLILFVLQTFLSVLAPLERKIHPEELWWYRYPITDSYVSLTVLWSLLFLIPLTTILIFYMIDRDKTDMQEAILSLTFAMGLTSVITNIIKLLTGRPRPDFLWRCFPSGVVRDDMKCNGDAEVISEGRKSFPSGHSSLSFASMGFLSLYLMAKLRVFNGKGRGHGFRFVVCLLPTLLALCVALSRFADYHHHGIDIVAGCVLGLIFAYLSYHQHYPNLDSPLPHLSYIKLNQNE